MPHAVTPGPLDPSGALTTSSSNYDDAATVLRLRTLRGAIDIVGLSPAEAEVISEAWSRCDPRELSVTEALAEPTAHVMRRTENDSWNAFHESLVYQATASAIASGQGSLLMFHGAALKDPDSAKAFVLVAESGGGKTTATRELGKSFEYFTDETVGIDEDYKIFDFPKPLSILEGDMVRPKIQYGPEKLALLEPSGDASLSLICLLNRDKDGEKQGATAEPVPMSEAIPLIAPQTSSLSRLDRGLVRLCQAIDRVGGVQRLHYSEARDLSRLMADLLHARPEKPTKPSCKHHRPAGNRWIAAENLRPMDDPRSEPVGEEYMRFNVDDAVYFDDGSLCILVDEKFTVLHGAGPFIWELLETPLKFEDLAEEARDMDNAPEDVERILHQALESMIASGIVTQGNR